MNTNLEDLKKLTLQPMAGDMLKVYVSDATLLFRECFLDVLQVCEFVRRK